MKPVQGLFKLAAASVCLANEWRDTLFYAGAAFLFAQKNFSGDSSMAEYVLRACILREVARYIGWQCKKPQRLVGHSPRHINHLENGHIAMAVALGLNFADFAYQTITTPNIFKGVMASGIVSVLLVACNHKTMFCLIHNKIGPREICERYFDFEIGMWDWPRKNKNGPTQTQKLGDAFRSFGKRLAELVVPVPAHKTAPVFSTPQA